MIQSIFLTGLGGQGVLTAAGILADQATAAGLKVSLFNAKGMAQRGGRTTSELRLARDPDAQFGTRVSAGGADILIGMEIGETIDSFRYLREGGIVLLLNHAHVPAETVLTKQPYPTFEEGCRLFAKKARAVFALEAPDSPHNVFVLGAFAVLVPETDGWFAFFSVEALESAVAAKLKRGLEDNLRAFRRGCDYGRSLLQRT